MAGATGLEPATSGVTGRRSNQLSYTPEITIVPSAVGCIVGSGGSQDGVLGPSADGSGIILADSNFNSAITARSGVTGQWVMNTGSAAAVRIWLVAPPKIICRSRLWV